MDILREVLEEEEGFGEDNTIDEALESETYGTQQEPPEPLLSGQPESFSVSRKNSKRQRKKAAQPQPQPSSPSAPSIGEDDVAANTEPDPQFAERPSTHGADESESGSDAAEADSLNALLQMRGRTDSRHPEQHGTETTAEGEMDVWDSTSIRDVSHALVGNIKIADTSGGPLHPAWAHPAWACYNALLLALSTLMYSCRGRATRQSCTEEAEEEEERQSCAAG